MQLETVLDVCRRSRTQSEAGRTLFAASRARRKSKNDADRVAKLLGRYELDSIEALLARSEGPAAGFAAIDPSASNTDDNAFVETRIRATSPGTTWTSPPSSSVWRRTPTSSPRSTGRSTWTAWRASCSISSPSADPGRTWQSWSAMMPWSWPGITFGNAETPKRRTAP